MMSMCTQCTPPRRPEDEITFRLPTEAATLSGTRGARARITVSATMLPATKRAIVGAGYSGLARQPSGAVIVIGRKRPELVGTGACVSVSRRIERRARE